MGVPAGPRASELLKRGCHGERRNACATLTAVTGGNLVSAPGTDISRWEEYGRAHGEIFKEIRPASAMIQIARLIDPDMLVEIEADAIVE